MLNPTASESTGLANVKVLLGTRKNDLYRRSPRLLLLLLQDTDLPQVLLVHFLEAVVRLLVLAGSCVLSSRSPLEYPHIHSARSKMSRAPAGNFLSEQGASTRRGLYF